MEGKKSRLGVIADDFTGASDAASFLVKGGAETIMFNEVPKSLDAECDAVVIALKTRSAEPSSAINQTKNAVEFLKRIGCERIYFKYCSTFDSTPRGNIGIVADFLMETLGVDYTLLCPALPINGRTVKDGILYVDGIPLSESPLKDHPLNPMWDSYIPTLMKDQSKYPCFVLTREALSQGNMPDTGKEQHYYLVPDYETDADGRKIAERFKHLPLLSGGSGLLEFLVEPKLHSKTHHAMKQTRTILLCGSCSSATRKQIQTYQKHQGLCYKVDADQLLKGDCSALQIMDFITCQTRPVLVYSDAVEKDMQTLKQKTTFKQASAAIEQLMADLSELALQKGFNRIVVGGGETSGAITQRLGFEGFYIGTSIDPGVPELFPLKHQELTLILKSGNFGSEDFFVKASGGCKDDIE